MSNFTALLDRNTAFATTGDHEGLRPMPKHLVFVVTCMDARVDPAHFLGLDLGDALVFRNSGGRVTDAVIQEVAFTGAMTQRMLGVDAPVFEVAVIHHTQCGSHVLANDEFNAAFSALTGASPQALRQAAVLNPRTTVEADVARLRASSILPSNAVVSGHVYHLETGRIETIVPV